MAERLRFSGRRGQYARWFLYRLFKGKHLLYIGCTGDIRQRLVGHPVKGWDHYEVEDGFRSKKAALRAEALAITRERPPMNTPTKGTDKQERERLAREKKLAEQQAVRVEAEVAERRLMERYRSQLQTLPKRIALMDQDIEKTRLRFQREAAAEEKRFEERLQEKRQWRERCVRELEDVRALLAKASTKKNAAGERSTPAAQEVRAVGAAQT
jgi:predicted GIY-YIG superfamily endonuclease